MAELSTLPEVVNVDCYGGDTLTIHIKIDAAVIGTRIFSAQVRAKNVALKIDATFGVFLTAEGADIVLSSADSRALAARGLYEGVWDVQLSANGADPVTTLAYGEIRVHPDVTRLAT